MTISEAIGHVVRVERTKKKMAQSELGRRMKSPRTYISKVETGLCAPTVESLMRIAAAMETSGSELLSRSEAMMNSVNNGETVISIVRRSGSPNRVFVLPKSVADPEAIARRKKLAMALGTLPMEAA